MNTLQPAEETYVDQWQDGQTNNHEDGPQWGGLHPAVAAAAAATVTDDDDDDRVTRAGTVTAF